MYSFAQQRSKVYFPEHTGERVYMREFNKINGLPFDLKRWQPTVDAMLDGIDIPGPMFLMVDQKEVIPGQSHRRPGLHVDGHWVPHISAHGQGRHQHIHMEWDFNKDWRYRCEYPETMLLASDVCGAYALEGEWHEHIQEGGAVSSLKFGSMRKHMLTAGVTWALPAPTGLHESIPLPEGVIKRTLVRINIPGYRVQ